MTDTNKKIHSHYSDDIPVYEGEEPDQLPIRHGNFPIPDPQAGANPHTRLRWDIINQRVYQGRTFGDNGVPIKDIDFTRGISQRTGKAHSHIPVPHQQVWTEVVPGRPSAGYRRSKNHLPLVKD